MELSEIGQTLKEYRTSHHYTLKEFCDVHRLDPGTISRIERGCPTELNEELSKKLSENKNNIICGPVA